MPTDDDNHPSNYFYKRKVQTEGLVDGMYHLLDFGKMDTVSLHSAYQFVTLTLTTLTLTPATKVVADALLHY